MQAFLAEVRVALASGRGDGRGSIEIAQPSFSHRLLRAGALFLVGLAGGLLLLPVPLLHLMGVFFFLTLTVLAVRKVATRRVLQGASGSCPGCHAEGRYFVGFGGRKVKFPIKTSCKHCHAALQLWPPLGGGSA
jgi:hypothetical protein